MGLSHLRSCHNGSVSSYTFCMPLVLCGCPHMRPFDATAKLLDLISLPHTSTFTFFQHILEQIGNYLRNLQGCHYTWPRCLFRNQCCWDFSVLRDGGCNCCYVVHGGSFSVVVDGFWDSLLDTLCSWWNNGWRLWLEILVVLLWKSFTRIQLFCILVLNVDKSFVTSHSLRYQ